LILAYPGGGGRLLLSLRFTLTNQQLVQWLMCLLVLAAPLCVGGYKRVANTAK
jgi:hypothetical protein